MKKLCVARRVAGIVVIVVASASSAQGGVKKSQAALVNDVVKRLGLNVVEVGAPGNRAVLPSELSGPFSNPPPDFGVVNHRYRIMALEVDRTQWAKFLNAYAPTHEAAGGLRGDTSMAAGYTYSQNLSNPANYTPLSGSELAPHAMSWHVAARFANWLHNGAPEAVNATAKDFNNGAYDTSTFGTTVPRPNGTGIAYADQWRRSEGSLFWIPSLNEWTKAAHYDPDRYGEGEEGYWLRQGGQNDPLISAPPQFGGETNAGDSSVWSQNYPGIHQLAMPVGSYTDVLSPWGLMDTSGGQSEWAEDPPHEVIFPNGTLIANVRHDMGSSAGQQFYHSSDRLDWLSSSNANNSNIRGIRIALVIPAPATAACAVPALAYTFRRRRYS